MLSTLILSVGLVAIAPSGDYERALAIVNDASKEANRSTGLETIVRLKESLLALERFPEELSRDVEGRERRALAQLNLARLQLVGGDEAGAARTMDQAIFSAGPDVLPVDRFGPDIIALHERRAAALLETGRAKLQVVCTVECQIFVDSNAIAGDAVELYLGQHQVHIISDVVDPMTRMLVLGAEGAVVEYGPGESAMIPAHSMIPGPIVDPAVDIKSTKLTWGTVERPIPGWKLAGVGVSGGVFVISLGAAIGLTVALGPNGSVRKELISAAEQSLTDGKPSNDIEPDSNDICELARTTPEPSHPDEVTNAEITNICIKADRMATAAVSMYIVAGVHAAATIVFGLLVNTHRRPRTTRLHLQHRMSFVIVPRLEGGATALAGIRF